MTNRSFFSAVGTAALMATIVTPAFADDTTQTGTLNQTTSQNGPVASINNSARLTDNVARAASGNVGFNNASGIGNMQSNMLLLHGPKVSGDQDSYTGNLNVNQSIDRVGDVTVQGSNLKVTLGSATTDKTTMNNSSDSSSMSMSKTNSSKNSSNSSSLDVDASASFSYGYQNSKTSGSVKESGEGDSATASGSSSASATGAGSGTASGNSKVSTDGEDATASASFAAGQGSAAGKLDIDASASTKSSSSDSSSQSSMTSKSSTDNSSSMNSTEHNTVLTFAFEGSGGPSASIDGAVGQDAKGNIGVNNAAGAFNHQSNATLISTSLADSTADVTVNQTLKNTGNVIVANSSATIGGNAFQGAAGNIGVNQAAGAFNQQSNALIIH
ncbi:MAG: hypothetical protein NVSMB59_21300 [Vulcanimicrobiaceae bacterium]